MEAKRHLVKRGLYRNANETMAKAVASSPTENDEK